MLAPASPQIRSFMHFACLSLRTANPIRLDMWTARLVAFGFGVSSICKPTSASQLSSHRLEANPPARPAQPASAAACNAKTSQLADLSNLCCTTMSTRAGWTEASRTGGTRTRYQDGTVFTPFAGACLGGPTRVHVYLCAFASSLEHVCCVGSCRFQPAPPNVACWLVPFSNLRLNM